MRRTQADVDASSIDMSVSIRFLDDTQPLIVKYDKLTSGQQLFDRVCSHLQLLERGYFGLRYDADDGERYWLDALRTVHKQMKNVYMKVLNFRVRYYPPAPTTLVEGITRYYLFLQLRRDLLRGRLLCLSSDAVELAALIVQSEMGDYDPNEFPANYINEYQLLPRQNAKQEERICERHKELKGLLPADAEMRFLERASSLETYGVDPFVVQCTTAIDRSRRQLEEAVPQALLQPTFIGAHHRGVVVYCAAKPTLVYHWSEIANITYESKFVNLHLHGQPTFASLAAGTISPRSSTLDRDAGINDRSGYGTSDFVGESVAASKRKVHTYKCETSAASRAFWLIGVDQRAFFTLSRGADAPRVTSGGRIPLLSRNSKFRFSGRSERELLEDSKRINREQPSFNRTPLTRVARDVQAKRHSSLINVATSPSAQLTPVPPRLDNGSTSRIPDGAGSSSSLQQPAGAGQRSASPVAVTSSETYMYGAYGRVPSVNFDSAAMQNIKSSTPPIDANGFDYKWSNGDTPASSRPNSSATTDWVVNESIVKRDANPGLSAAPVRESGTKILPEDSSSKSKTERPSSSAIATVCRAVGVSLILMLILTLVAVLVFDEAVEVEGPLANLRDRMRSNAYLQGAQERMYQPLRRTVVSLFNGAH